MDDVVYCVLDASGSMKQRDKYSLCLSTALSISVSQQRGDFSPFSQLPSVKCVIWQDKMIAPKNFDENLSGQVSFQALQDWIEKRLTKVDHMNILLFSDGCFFDRDALCSFQEWLKAHPQVQIVVIGAGADLNAVNLQKVATVGQVYKLTEAMVALSVIGKRPLTFNYGSQNEIERRMSGYQPNDSEEDLW